MTDRLWPTVKGAFQDDTNEHSRHDSRASDPKTVLPSPLASIVSLATSATSFGLRVGGYFGGAAINGARIGTLTSFELGRVIIEGILTRAGNDVILSSAGEQGRLAAEGLLERSLSTLHFSITHTSFLISTGFQIGSTSLASSLAVSQFFLSGLDAVFGDTETSKAVATIISLVRREFKNPETGVGDEKVGLGDLVLGISSFALLQRWEAAKTKQELSEAQVTETLWDVVIINDGTMPKDASFEDDATEDAATAESLPQDQYAASFVSATGHSETFDAIQDHTSLLSRPSSRDFSDTVSRTSQPTEEAFRQFLASQLRPGSSVQLIAESKITDRLEIQVKGDAEADIQPPPGFSLLAVERQTQWDGTSTFIFQRSRRKRRRGSFGVDASAADLEDDQQLSAPLEDLDTGEGIEWNSGHPLPPETQNSEFSDSGDSHHNEEKQPNALDDTKYDIGTTKPQQSPDNAQNRAVAANQKRPRAPKASQSSLSTNLFSVPRLSPSDNQVLAENRERTSPNIGIENSPLRKAMSKSKSVKNLVDFWNRERQKPSRNKAGPANRLNGFTSTSIPDEPTLASNPSLSALRVPERNSSINFFGYGSQSPQDGLRTAKGDSRPTSSTSHHRHRSSVYSIASAASETSLMLRPLPFDDYLPDYAASLRRNAFAPGQYPKRNFASNVSRFARFSLASYGSNFLRLTGIFTGTIPTLDEKKHLPQHHSFSYYNNLPPSTVLLSSYVDTQVGPYPSSENDSGMPLVYYVTLDHESKAVILTCRGTLGFEDILTDMTAEYSNITWQSQIYQVHQGVYASARRLLQLDNQRILTTIKAALEEFDDYGLVLCGHSLGGAVASMLAIFLSQRNTASAGGAARFVTCSYSSNIGSLPLPPNRPIHAYAYGPAACVSPALQRASRGLVTTITHRDDIVPYLSLGTLRDFQAIAWAFKIDTNGAKGEVRRRVLASLLGAFRKGSSDTDFSVPSHSYSAPQSRGWFGFSSWWPYGPNALEELEEDHWSWSALRSLRASLLADKLVPPGDVFLVEATPVLQRDAFVSSDAPGAGTNAGEKRDISKKIASVKNSKQTKARNIEDLRPDDQDDDNDKMEGVSDSAWARTRRSYKPATRLTVQLVRDVDRRFSEIRFSSSMFTDHFPARYLNVLEELDRAIGS